MAWLMNTLLPISMALSLVRLLFMQPIKPRWACLEHIIHVEMVNPNPNLHYVNMPT